MDFVAIRCNKNNYLFVENGSKQNLSDLCSSGSGIVSTSTHLFSSLSDFSEINDVDQWIDQWSIAPYHIS